MSQDEIKLTMESLVRTSIDVFREYARLYLAAQAAGTERTGLVECDGKIIAFEAVVMGKEH